MPVAGVTPKRRARGEIARAGIGFSLRDGPAVARVPRVRSWHCRVEGNTDEAHQFANDSERLVWDRLS